MWAPVDNLVRMENQGNCDGEKNAKLLVLNTGNKAQAICTRELYPLKKMIVSSPRRTSIKLWFSRGHRATIPRSTTARCQVSDTSMEIWAQTVGCYKMARGGYSTTWAQSSQPEAFLCGEKCEKSRKNPPFGDRKNAEVTGFNGKVTAGAVKWDWGVAKITGRYYRVTSFEGY